MLHFQLHHNSSTTNTWLASPVRGTFHCARELGEIGRSWRVKSIGSLLLAYLASAFAGWQAGWQEEE